MGMGGTMDGCGRCLKFSLIVINIITFFGGGLLLAFGLWVWTTRSYAASMLSSNMFVAAMATLIGLGVFLMIISFLGCAGAAMEVKCMLLTYYIIVFIIFVLMLVAGIMEFVFREKITGSLDRELYASIPYYGVKHEYTKSWDDTQMMLQCCGVRGFKDWNDNVPESCCKEVYPGKRLDCKASPNPTTMHMDGCRDPALKVLRSNALVLGVTSLIVATIMLLGLVFSCGLFVKIE